MQLRCGGISYKHSGIANFLQNVLIKYCKSVNI